MTWRMELHLHTTASHDGHIDVGVLARVAVRRQLDVIAVTDHDTIDGAREAQAYFRRRHIGCQIVIGEERTLSDGSHVIGHHLQEPLQGNTVDEVLREIHDQRGVVVLPHPFRRRDGVCRDGREDAVFDAVRRSGAPAACEVFNPKCSWKENQAAVSWCQGRLPAVVGSDAHYAGDIGEALLVVPQQGNVDPVQVALEGPPGTEWLGIGQQPGQSGRKYAGLYYRIKPYLAVPKRLVPLASAGYRQYHNWMTARRPRRMEAKWPPR